MKKRMTGVLALAFIFMVAATCAAFAQDQLTATLTSSDGAESVTVKSATVDGEQWFLLPGALKEENFSVDGGQTDHRTMRGSRIASLFIESSDPDGKGIEYIHASKDNKAEGTARLFDEDFNQIYKGSIDALKGRGNTTWWWSDKKPYQIKLSKKADLMDPANGTQKAKKWILLANAFDPTLVRNQLIYGFSRELGLSSTPDGRPVDLYYDGEYRGMYYLCEKVEPGSGRVEINDLEADNEDANPDLDFDGLKTVEGTDPDGGVIRYSEEIKDPEDISGGYLLELDNAYYREEPSYFGTFPGADDPVMVVSKSPEVLSKAQAEYISEVWQTFGRCVRNKGRDPVTGKALFEVIDKDSLVKCLLTFELFQVNDCFLSSTFFYKDSGDDKLYAGPVWDCDSSMGIQIEDHAYNVWFSAGIGRMLREIPEVRQAMVDEYKSHVRPIAESGVLGGKDGAEMQSLSSILSETEASALMNYMVWDINDCDGTCYPVGNYKGDVDYMLSWLDKRIAWMDETIMDPAFPKDKSVPAVTPKLKAGRRAITVSWKKPAKASGYQIRYSTAKSFKKYKTVTVKGRKYTKKTIRKLKAKKRYYVKMRAYRTISGKRYYGKWSKVKPIKTR